MKAPADDMPGLELMTRDELLELAPLDALGLLDEYDAALFTRSFHHASAAVQDEIRELQATIATDERLLADADLPASLRPRVLAAVAEKAAEASEDLAPLAVIGARRTRGVPEGARPRHSTAPAWRAASFALAACLLVGFFFGLQLWERNQQLMDLALGLGTQEQFSDLAGRSWQDFAADPAVQRIALEPTDAADADAHAIVYVDEESDTAFVLTIGLPQGKPLTVVATDADGTRHELRSVQPRGQAAGVRIATAALEALACTWSIEDADGNVLMRS